jgi:hypothetical protein
MGRKQPRPHPQRPRGGQRFHRHAGPFGYIREGNINPFEDGIVWLVSGLILAITANAFRREHHVVDPDERRDVSMR